MKSSTVRRSLGKGGKRQSLQQVLKSHIRKVVMPPLIRRFWFDSAKQTSIGILAFGFSNPKAFDYPMTLGQWIEKFPEVGKRIEKWLDQKPNGLSSLPSQDELFLLLKPWKRNLLILILSLVTCHSSLVTADPMNDKVVRDPNGNVIARIDETATGKIIRDPSGNLIGRVDKNDTGKTIRDASGNIIGRVDSDKDPKK